MSLKSILLKKQYCSEAASWRFGNRIKDICDFRKYRYWYCEL